MHALVLVSIDPNTKFEVSSSTDPKIIVGPQHLKMNHLTLITPLSGMFAIRRLGHAMVNLPSKSEVYFHLLRRYERQRKI